MPPVATRWTEKDGRWALVWSNTHTVEYRGAAVLFYEGPGQPLRELAPSWETRYIESLESLESFEDYVETLLPDTRRDSDDLEG